MTDTDGFEIIHYVRALPQPPPLIVMSACAVASGVFREGQALGAAASLHKPFKPEQLLSVIDEVLRPAATA